MNKLLLIGNLTRDPELAQTSSGVSVCKFSIAVNRNYTNANGERDADYINIIAWRGLAESCSKYLSKGKKVAICGSLQTSSYEASDGTKRYRTDVVADEVEFLSPPAKETSEPKQTAQTAQKKPKQTSFDELKPIEDDGLPF